MFYVLLVAAVVKNGCRCVHISDVNVKLGLQLRRSTRARTHFVTEIKHYNYFCSPTQIRVALNICLLIWQSMIYLRLKIPFVSQVQASAIAIASTTRLKHKTFPVYKYRIMLYVVKSLNL